jgi:Uma2 family endonuclease
MSAHALPRFSPEEYLRIERDVAERHEYDNGAMYSMSGGSLSHAGIAAQVLTALRREGAGAGCKAVGPDLKVQVSPEGPFYYPDVVIYCGTPQLADSHQDILVNPKTIVEVLSKSTEDYDRGRKFTQYRQIATLHEYVLVSQWEPRVEVFSRTEDSNWSMAEFVGLDAVCELKSVNCRLALAEIYLDITFPAL